MPKQKIYNRYKLFGHLIFWVASVAFLLFFFYYNEQKVHLDAVTLSKALVTNVGFAVGVYINLYVLIPRFLKKKNYIFYIFWLIVLLTLCSLLIQFLFIFPLREILHLEERFSSFNPSLHSAFFFAILIYVAFTSFLKFIKDWLTLQDLNLKIARVEQQKLEAELKTLKGQLNPHFLFNSLNNIYSLALIQSEKVPELILKLSDLMRHIIYESRENFIPLEKEIEFVNNFVALQKIRTPENVDIKYELKGEIPSGKIAPLLFEPFIDNAFKHGLSGNEENDYIHITFDFSEQNNVIFHLENNFTESTEWNKKNSGIGIQNVKQRLKYLYDTKDYNLEVLKENHIFTVNLQLKLK